MTQVSPASDHAASNDHGIELWTAPLDNAELEDRLSLSLLSEEERERASRLRFEPDRTRFTASRLWLRFLLAQRLRVDPSAVCLQARPGGKPEVSPPLPASLRFSMSRSGALGLYAFAEGSDVGVDLENRSGAPELEAVAGRFFSPPERAALAGFADRAAPEDKLRVFYRIWTRKEAVLKALGVGLDAPLEALDVSGDVASWDTSCAGVPADRRRWFVHDLDVPPDWAGAFATEAVVRPGELVVRDARQLLDADRVDRRSGQVAGPLSDRPDDPLPAVTGSDSTPSPR